MVYTDMHTRIHTSKKNNPYLTATGPLGRTV